MTCDALPQPVWHNICYASYGMHVYVTLPAPLSKRHLKDVYYWPRPVSGAFTVSSKRTRKTEQALFSSVFLYLKVSRTNCKLTHFQLNKYCLI